MERWAVTTGLASDPLIWNGGTLPLPTDDVYANGFVITVDTNTTWASVQTRAGVSAVAGGGFVLGNGVTLTANVFAGTTNCITHSSAAAINIIGNVTGSLDTTGIVGVSNDGDGTVNITGNVMAGPLANLRGADNIAGGRINVQGNAIGDGGIAVYNTATGAILINGDAIGGSISGASGVHDAVTSTGRVTVLGYAIGGMFAAGTMGAGLNPVRVYRARVGPTGSAAVVGKVVFYNPGATTYELKDVTLTSKVLKRSIPGTTVIPLRNWYRNERRYTTFVQ